MGQSRLLLLTFPIILASVPSWGLYVPAGFVCTRATPTSGAHVYSTPPNRGPMTLYVDLIHIFCGEVYNHRGHGFHARPLNVDPGSVDTRHARVIKRAANDGDTSVYGDVRIYINAVNYEYKDVSSIWPTRWTMERLVEAITVLDERCG